MSKSDDPPLAVASTSGETAPLFSHQPDHRASFPAGPSPYHSLPPPVVYEQHSATQAADRRARTRFFEALLWGVGIWMALGLLTGGIVLDEGNHHERRPHDGNWATRRSEGSTCKSVPALGASYVTRLGTFTPFVLVRAFGPQRPMFESSRTTFPLSLSAESTLSLVGNGDWSTGEVVYDVVDGEGRIEVEARWNDAGLMDESRVCVVEDGSNVALQITTPTRRYRYRNRQLSYSIKVYLPAVSSLGALKVDALFSVDSDSPRFPPTTTVDIRTANRRISLSHLVAQSISLHTTNAQITLETITTDDLKITSTNNLVQASRVNVSSANVASTNGGIFGSFLLPGRDSVLVLATSNAPIDVRVALMQPEDSKGKYLVDAKTSNGKVDVGYTTQAEGSYLDSRVVTSNAGVRVEHAREYQGAFEATTLNSGVQVVFAPSVQHRVYDRSHAHEAGVVWRGKEDVDVESRGKSVVVSVNAHVEMSFK